LFPHLHFGPPRSAWQVFWAARERFGDLACIDLLFDEQ
jgi:hypothetical protein